jgi:hypothetical protein
LEEQLKTVLDRESASQKRHDDRMEALERSHKALLKWAKCFRYHTENNQEDFQSINADIAAAEKL